MDGEVNSRLRAALDDQDLDVVWAAIRALPGADAPDAREVVPALRRLVQDQSEQKLLRTASAARLLAGIEPETEGLVETLIRVVEQKDNPNPEWDARAMAVDGLGRLGGRAEPAVSVLIQIVGDDQMEVISFRVEGGGYAFSYGGGPKPGFKSVRVRAIEVLGQLGPAAQEAIPVLRSLIEPRNERTSQATIKAAVEAMGKVSGSK
ncbi:MAG TPA: hypothetical protein VML55_23510 [Planctomycetaceae bacterium]|nr:hypothetical protein [Planctomycetaceae bacterium]